MCLRCQQAPQAHIQDKQSRIYAPAVFHIRKDVGGKRSRRGSGLGEVLRPNGGKGHEKDGRKGASYSDVRKKRKHLLSDDSGQTKSLTGGK